MSTRIGISYSVDTLPMDPALVEVMEDTVFGILGNELTSNASIRVMHSPADEDSAGRGWFRIESIKELPAHRLSLISRIFGFMADNIETKEI